MLLAGFELGSPDNVTPDAWLVVRDGRVAQVGAGGPPGRPDVDLGGALVVPGFVDLHCHGGAGSSYTSGDPESAARLHRRHGTTTTLASTVSAEAGDLARQVRSLADLARSGLVAGIHLEGPYLAEARCGAHDPAFMRDADPSEIRRLLDEAAGTIRMVTLAPERAGAIEAVRQLVGAGVVAAVGHTEATYDQTCAAIAAGVSVATHLGNAMPPVHQRAPGPVLALLDSDRVVCEVINDGVHLHPGMVGHVLRSAGPGRIALVTDATAAAGAPDGDYTLGSVTVRVAGGEARVRASGVLAGSTLTMDAAFRRAVHECGFSIPDAVRAASTTPASLLGLPGLGRLVPASRADLVVLDSALVVQGVLHGGRWVDDAPPPPDARAGTGDEIRPGTASNLSEGSD
jgi:N-acetylglucosamine-6-phosphate deacetylase